MQRILFICHGNICRSPMAEFIMKALLKAKGLENSYYVESAAVSTEEIGNPIYPPAKRCLSNHGVIFDAGKRARQVVPERDAMWQIRGTPEISRPPFRTSSVAVKQCCPPNCQNSNFHPCFLPSYRQGH